MSTLHRSSVSESLVTSVTDSNNSVIAVPEGCVTRQVMTFVPWDNEYNLVSMETESMFTFLMTGICLPLLFIVGFVTNIISMIAFYKLGLMERINACLFTLSFVDLLGVSMAFGICSDAVYVFVMGKQRQLGPVFQFFIRNYLTGLYGLVTASQMVYAVIAVERCLCITRPLLVKNLMSTRTIVIALWVMTFMVTGGYVFSGGVFYGVLCVFEPRDSSVSYVSYPTDFYFRHQFIMDILFSIVYGLFLPSISLVCVMVCTVVIVIKLKKLSKWREKTTSASDTVTSRDLVMTRVFVGTSILFIVCVLPSVLMRSSSLVVPDLKVGGRYDNLAWVTRRIYQVASAINNTFNFFVYHIFGTKFRETTHQLLSNCYCNANTKDKTATQSGTNMDVTRSKTVTPINQR